MNSLRLALELARLDQIDWRVILKRSRKMEAVGFIVIIRLMVVVAVMVLASSEPM